MRISLAIVAVAGMALTAGTVDATTLLKMSMSDLITQSTAIVRAKIGKTRSAAIGPNIYTLYEIQVSDTLKQGAILPAEVAVPGGVVGNLRQIGIGSPELVPGQEYVLFLWTGRSGMTQLIGLSQGLFKMTLDSSGAAVVNRAAVDDRMVDKSGQAVADTPVTMKWTDLRALIVRSLQKPAAK